MKISGCTEFAVRLPSALAALFCLYGIKVLGKELFNPRIALLAGWMTLGCWCFLFTARIVSADITGTAAAVWIAACFFRLEHKTSFYVYFLFYLLCAAGVFLSGLTVLVMPFSIVLPWLFYQKKWKKHLNWKNISSFIIVLGLSGTFFYIPSIMPVAPGQSGTIGVEEMLKTLWLFETENSWHDYLYNLPRILLPWLPFLAAGLAGMAVSSSKLPPHIRKSAAGAAVGTLLLLLWPAAMLQPVKWNCLVSAMPFIILYGAGGLTRYGIPAWNKAAFNILYYLGTVASSIAAGSLLFLPLWKNLVEYSPAPALIIAPVAAGAIAWYALFLDHREESSFSRFIGLPHRVGSPVFAITLLSGTFFGVLMPVIQMDFRTGKKFCYELKQKISDTFRAEKNGSVLYLGANVPEEYLFYNDLAAPLVRVSSLNEAAAKMPGKKLVIFMKNKQREQFISQAEGLKITPPPPLLTERPNRWKSADSQSGDFSAFLITLPTKDEK
ncbi:MAG: glycosyltransferase family 39 protein [Lentisphaeria bacterium]|nr:glycosyltransferase family 39 protein [Lentisphaeria bacterium]